MKKILLILFISFFISAEAQNNDKFSVKWKNGLNIENSDKSFSFKFGGRIQYDVMFISQSDTIEKYFPGGVNGTEFRRARLYTKGTIYKNIKYKFQIDFAHGKVTLKDIYFQFTKIPVIGNLRLGHFKEPFGMEMMTSSNFITMMERPLANQFDFDRALGFMIYNHHFNKRFSWYAGYFYPDLNFGIYKGKKYNLTFRVVGQPVYKTSGKYVVLHTGVGYSYGFHNNKLLIYKTRPESHLAPKYINLEIDEVRNSSSFKGELAFIYGPFSMEGEYTMVKLKLPESSAYKNDKYVLNAYFVTVSWFLTGEHKNYSQSKGAFDRLSPKKNLGNNSGIGAVELALRYSNIDFIDKDITGGKMGNITAGLNWYLNPVTKISFNYIYSDIDFYVHDQDLNYQGKTGKVNIFQMRFQLTF